MYVPYDVFVKYGISDITEEQYEKLAPMADAVIDDWTLGRVGKAVGNGEDLPGTVVTLYCAIVESLPPAIEGSKPSKGGLVTSFSNGIDSYSFDVSETVSQQLRRSLGWMLDLLPVEWCSACVRFAGGNAYAG